MAGYREAVAAWWKCLKQNPELPPPARPLYEPAEILCYDYNDILCPETCVLVSRTREHGGTRPSPEGFVWHTRFGCTCCPRHVAVEDDWRYEREVINNGEKIRIPVPVWNYKEV